MAAIDNSSLLVKDAALAYLINFVPLSTTFFGEVNIKTILIKMSPLLCSSSPAFHNTCLSLLCALHHRSRDVLYRAIIALRLHQNIAFMKFIELKIPNLSLLIKGSLQPSPGKDANRHHADMDSNVVKKCPSVLEIDVKDVIRNLEVCVGDDSQSVVEYMHALGEAIIGNKFDAVTPVLRQQIFICLLDIIKDHKNSDIRQSALICLKIFVENLAMDASSFLDITCYRLLACCNDAEATPVVVDTAQKCIYAWLLGQRHLSMEISSLLIRMWSDPTCMASISIQKHTLESLLYLVSHISSTTVMKIVSDIVRVLEESIHSDASEIRRVTVDLYVILHNILGDHIRPYLDKLPVNKVRYSIFCILML